MSQASRVRELVPAFMTALRTLCRDHHIVNDELYAALDFLTRVGRADEMVLLSDVLWLSVLIDSQTNAGGIGVAESNVRGPFHRDGAPVRTELSHGPADGEPFVVTIETLDAVTGTT